MLTSRFSFYILMSMVNICKINCVLLRQTLWCLSLICLAKLHCVALRFLCSRLRFLLFFSSSRTHQYSLSVCLSLLIQVKTAALGHRKVSTLQSTSDQNHFLNNSRRSFCKNEVFSGGVTENPFFFVNF